MADWTLDPPGWIGVDEEKPDTPREVLVRILDSEVPEGGKRVTAMWWNGAWRDPWGGSYHGRLANNAITHWKDIDPPLPESLP